MNYPIEKSGDYSAASSPLIVPETLAGQRLDQGLAALIPEHSRNRLQGWIKAGRVEVNGRVIDEPKFKLLGGESIRVEEEAPPEDSANLPEDIPLEVVFEDDSILVINKPAGLVVHPAAGNWSGTLLNGLLFHCPELASIPRAGIVHRLDKDTSGLMVVAKTLVAQTNLVRQLQARTVKREYVALAIGEVSRGGTVDADIGRHPTQRTRMAVVRYGGKPARTHYRVMERFAGYTLLECSLETGRTHQIRVHMASIGHPLVGDPLYAGHRKRLAFPRQALHAKRLGLIHPVSGEAVQWQCALPEDMNALLRDLRGQRVEMRNLADEDDEDDYDVTCYYVGDGDFDDDDE